VKYRWPRMWLRIELALMFLGVFGSFLTIGSVVSRYTGEPAVVHLCFGAAVLVYYIAARYLLRRSAYRASLKRTVKPVEPRN
jgi:hypothetical protein